MPATEVAFSINQAWLREPLVCTTRCDGGRGLRKADAEGGGMVRWATSDEDPGNGEDGRAATPAPVPLVWTVSNSRQRLVPRVVRWSLYWYALYNHLFTIAPGANGAGRRVVDRMRGIRYTSMCFLLPDMPSCLAGCRSGGEREVVVRVGPEYARVGLGWQACPPHLQVGGGGERWKAGKRMGKDIPNPPPNQRWRGSPMDVEPVTGGDGSDKRL